MKMAKKERVEVAAILGVSVGEITKALRKGASPETLRKRAMRIQYTRGNS